MKVTTPASGAGLGTDRPADPGHPRKVNRRIRSTRESLETAASPATPPDECGAAALQSQDHYSWPIRFRYRAHSVPAAATVTAPAIQESNDSAIFHRGFESESRPRREKSAPETHPTSARRSRSRPTVIGQPAWKASARPAGLQEGSCTFFR